MNLIYVDTFFVISCQLFEKLKNIKLPPIDSKAFTAMNSWFSKTAKFIKEKISSLRKILTTKYSTAIKVAKGLKNAFFTLTGYIGGGKIYLYRWENRRGPQTWRSTMSLLNQISFWN